MQKDEPAKKTSNGFPTPTAGHETVPWTETIEQLLTQDDEYTYFKQRIKNYILSENPGILPTEIESKSNEMWCRMSEVEKQEIFVRQKSDVSTDS